MSMKRSKILYAASTASHLRRFHMPYIEALSNNAEVVTMANGEGVNLCVPFAKSFFSPSNFKCIFQIRKILKQERFDRVILNTSLTAFLVRAAMMGMKHRPYVLNVVHGYLFPREVKGFKNRFLLLCEKLMRPMTDDIAVMNRDDLAIAKAYKLCRGRVFMTRGMGIPDTPFCADGADRVREEFGIGSNELLLLFVGELSRRKNQGFLISGMAHLRQKGVPVKLLLLGEGSERDTLEKQISEMGLSDHVFLAGNREPIIPYLSAADLYVSASLSEGLPFNVMEAMDAGLPILASDTKGQSDLLSAYEGCLYPLDDEAAFCNALFPLIKSHSRGCGSRSYPSLAGYRLSAVFEENMKIFTLGAQQHEHGN